MTRGRWSGRAKARTGSNADVSFVPPKIPDGEFSSVRFQGRFIRRCLPAENIKRFAFVLRAPCYCAMPPRCVEDRSASVHHRSSDLCRFALPQGSSLQAGYAVPPFNAYRPHAPRSPAHSDFASPANTECHRCQSGSPLQSVCDDPCCLRLMKEGSASGASVSRPFLRLLSLRPDDSLTTRRMVLSIGFQDSVSFLPAIQATGLWLLPW